MTASKFWARNVGRINPKTCRKSLHRVLPVQSLDIPTIGITTDWYAGQCLPHSRNYQELNSKIWRAPIMTTNVMARGRTWSSRRVTRIALMGRFLPFGMLGLLRATILILICPGFVQARDGLELPPNLFVISINNHRLAQSMTTNHRIRVFCLGFLVKKHRRSIVISLLWVPTAQMCFSGAPFSFWVH